MVRPVGAVTATATETQRLAKLYECRDTAADERALDFVLSHYVTAGVEELDQ